MAIIASIDEIKGQFEAGPSEIVKTTGIALGTVRQALERLLLIGKVKRVGRGRGIRYIKN